MVAVVAFEFSVMRCQPLRRALGYTRKLGIYGIKNKRAI
ncbi:iron transporter [Vibrio cholerae]|nr:iron transporter [Vibrio cholerae]TLE14855.1 iron transporter [Vibrio cholerae]